MSSPISGIGGNALNTWSMTLNPLDRPAAPSSASGRSFAQIAAGLGIDPQPYDTGATGTATGTAGTGAAGTDQGGTGIGSIGSTGSGQSNVVQAGTGTTTGTQGGVTQSAGTSADLGATTGTSGTRSTGAGTIADLSGTDTFLKLLVAQLKNQDPTSPMDDQAFVTELAQFNTVEQMLNLKQAIDTQTTAQQASEGISLLGRTVSYAAAGVGSNQTVTSQGTVTGVSLAGGKVELQIGGQPVNLSAVTAVSG